MKYMFDRRTTYLGVGRTKCVYSCSFTLHTVARYTLQTSWRSVFMQHFEQHTIHYHVQTLAEDIFI